MAVCTAAPGDKGPARGRCGLIVERAKGGNGLAIRAPAPQFAVMTEPLRLDRALFAISGPDTTEFLQNLVTNDVSLLARQPVIYAGILSPQGKVTAEFILWRTDEGVLVDVHARAADALRAKLTLYRLRAKVEIGPIEGGLGVFAGDITGGAILSAADPRMAEALSEVPVEVICELGSVRLGLRRVLSLQVGQVLRLDTAVDDPVSVRVAGIKKFVGVPVISRGQLAVEVRGRHEA